MLAAGGIATTQSGAVGAGGDFGDLLPFVLLLLAAVFWFVVAVWALVGRSRARAAAYRLEKEHGLFRDPDNAADTSAAATPGQTDGLGLHDAAPFPVWLRDERMRLVAVNAAYVRAVEAESAEQVLQDQIEIVDNALTGSTRETAQRAFEKGEAIAQRHFAIVVGQRRALAVTDMPVAEGVVGFAIDVTEAEEARAEVARLVDSHAETMNKLLSPVAIFDAEQHLQFFNSAFASMSRLSEDWLSEKPDHASLLEAMRECRRLPEQADFQAWKREQLELHHCVEPVEDLWHLPDGTALRMVAQPHPLGGLLLLFDDVTDRLALEGSYNTLIAVQRETLNNLHEAVAVFGSDGRLKLYNPSYSKIWNLDPEFLESEPHFGEILERARPLLYEGENWTERKNLLLGQIGERQAQSGRWHRHDGRVLDYALVPLPDGRVLTTHLDITDSVRIERALRERSEALETADRLKSEFVAHMSYELRTPLNSIIGFSELIAGGIAGPLSETQSGYLGYVLQAAGELRDLIDDILDLAVLEAGAMSLDIETVSVEDLVESVLAISREQSRKGGLQLDAKVAPDCGSIEGDQRRLVQAVYNIVTNAVKFTPEGGRVILRARPCRDQPDHIEIVVRDTGVGIADEDRDLVFEKFFTAPGQSTRSGVGLGLSLVQSFVELHGGTVELNSEAQKGTTVTCRLPRRQPADASVRAAV